MRADGERLADFTPTEHLELAAAARHQPMLEERFGGDHRAGLESLAERIEVDDVVLNPEGIVETALRNAPVQRHLAAFEPTLELVSRSRLGALVSASSR